MAPYAIAHLKVGLKLYETGYLFESHERVRIYLTNALEPAQDSSGQLEFVVPALAHEAQAVSAVKEKQKFTAIVGNPPYAIMSANLSAPLRVLVDDFRFVDGVKIVEKSAIVFERTLQDDYVKFFALAGKLLRESTIGVLGYISNDSYLESINLRGMRADLSSRYSRMDILALHGDADRREVSTTGDRDENVFDIKKGVAIAIARRLSPPSSGDGLTVTRGDLLGSRESKYEALLLGSQPSANVTTFSPSPERYLFLDQDDEMVEEFRQGIPLDDLFLARATGIETGKDSILVDFDEEGLRSRLARFGDPSLPDALIRSEFDAEAGIGRTIADRRSTILSDSDFEKSASKT